MHDTPSTPVSASDIAYADIKSRILEGDLPGGAMVSEGAIADALGMSRTPVREAFLRLQAEGWMRLYPKRGALVIEARPHELQEVVEARVLIETDAARRITADPERAAAVIEQLRPLIQRQREAYESGDLVALAEADAAFHAAIVDAGGNALLSDFFATLGDRQRRMVARSLWNRNERTQQVLADHEWLLQLIGTGDVEAFHAALAEHLRATHRELLP